MKSIFKNKICLALIVAIVVTVASIFIHSLMSPEVSSTESEVVGGVVDGIVETIAPNNHTLRDYIKKNIRKIAHFAEFGLLGFEATVAAYVFLMNTKMLYKKAKTKIFIKAAGVAAVFGLIVAFLDESLQLLSNRGPQIKDMWIDLAGYCAFSVFAVAVILVISLIIRSAKNKRNIS